MKCWNSAFNAQGSRWGNYSTCTCRSSENICSSSGGAQGKRKNGVKTGWNSVWHKKWCTSEFDSLPWMLVHFFAGFLKKSHSVLDQTQGSGAVFSWLYGKL